jgi:phenylalanyl-tRNA synthetase alpha chain
MEAESLQKEIKEKINQIKNLNELEEIRVYYLGRNGKITNILKSLKNFSLEERKIIGPKVQLLKKETENLIFNKKQELERENLVPKIDLTKPAKKLQKGHLHLLTLVEQRMRQIFSGMNFSVVDGPELENEYYNFDALNFPPKHPAREMQDTFWIKQENNNINSKQRFLLRTHTSPVQVRFMEKNKPPFQIIVPGRVFRNEALDSGHEINFYQLEGLMVGKNITLANFKFIIEEFFHKFFNGEKIEFRYRPSYFPFVEPGIELIIKYKGKWFEVAGAGMVHKHVFEYAHYNPRDFQGFAFGVGIDRLAMIKYKIPDIRLFYGGDLRFINQF